MRNSPITPSLQDEVLAARLAIAKATLAKLQARLPEPAPPQYTPYEEHDKADERYYERRRNRKARVVSLFNSLRTLMYFALYREFENGRIRANFKFKSFAKYIAKMVLWVNFSKVVQGKFY